MRSRANIAPAVSRLIFPEFGRRLRAETGVRGPPDALAQLVGHIRSHRTRRRPQRPQNREYVALLPLERISVSLRVECCPYVRILRGDQVGWIRRELDVLGTGLLHLRLTFDLPRSSYGLTYIRG